MEENENNIDLPNKLNNVKQKINLKGDEIKLDLNNKNIDDRELKLLSHLKFENVEFIDLSHNKISNIKILKDLNLSNLKRLKDLSFNKSSKNERNIHNKKTDKNDKMNYSENNNLMLSED